jgi:hypothetical protein
VKQNLPEPFRQLLYIHLDNPLAADAAAFHKLVYFLFFLFRFGNKSIGNLKAPPYSATSCPLRPVFKTLHGCPKATK